MDFTTPAAPPRRTVEFTYDGEPLVARQPKQSTVANLVLVADSAKTDPIGVVRHFKAFLMDCLEPDSYDHLIGRIDDPDDDLDWNTLDPMVEWLVEEFVGGSRPTKRPSASTRRPTSRKSGNPSTGRSRSSASTPATSTQTAS